MAEEVDLLGEDFFGLPELPPAPGAASWPPPTRKPLTLQVPDDDYTPGDAAFRNVESSLGHEKVQVEAFGKALLSRNGSGKGVFSFLTRSPSKVRRSTMRNVARVSMCFLRASRRWVPHREWMLCFHPRGCIFRDASPPPPHFRARVRARLTLSDAFSFWPRRVPWRQMPRQPHPHRHETRWRIV